MATHSAPRTGVLVILDGFGINPEKDANAVAMAKTPTLDRIRKNYPSTSLDASESHVGLPRGFMGNSEVGHLNIGAGRIVFQDFSLISQAIDSESFFNNVALLELFGKLKESRKKNALHLMGLLSDGGVHSHLSHLYALLTFAKRQGFERVYIHCFMDGRDTSPTSGAGFLRQLKAYLADMGMGKVASVMGRFYAMDRDKRWERVEEAYRAIVLGSGNEIQEPETYVRESYDQSVTDEFIHPAVVKGYPGVKDGDGVIFYNFRADRARELTRALTQKEFPHFRRENVPTLAGFVCMTPYEEGLDVTVAYGKPKVPKTLGELVSQKGWKQVRVAETEKYAHVTYFFNGGDEKVFEGEKRVLVPSPRDVKTYDLKPEMAANQVLESLMKELETGQYSLAVVNFANPDMVGHTGNLRAAISAVEAVDTCLGKLVNWVEANEAFLILTADHGNCEMMIDSTGAPMTAHTLFPVPFILVDPKNSKTNLLSGGRLCDIAPTILNVWGVEAPPEMTGRTLLG